MSLFGASMTQPQPLLAPCEILDCLAALDSRPFAGRAVSTEFFVATARLASHFLATDAPHDISLLNCFVHNLSSSALLLLSNKLSPAKQQFVADCALLTQRLHSIHCTTAALGSFKLLLEACRKQHRLGGQFQDIWEYYAELLVAGNQEIYQALSRNFTTLCNVIADVDPCVQPTLLAILQSVVYLDDAPAFTVHHKELVKMLTRITKGSTHQELHSAIKQAITAKLLSQYAAGEINSIVRQAADAALSDSCSDCGASTSFYAASDTSSLYDSDDSDDEEIA